MRKSRLQRQHRPSRWNFFPVALLVICALLSHSLDNCAEHLGEFAAFEKGAPQISACCAHALPDVCNLCSQDERPHSDGCGPLTEIAVVKPAPPHETKFQTANFVPIVAVIPAMPQLIALSGSLHGRAAPPPFAPPVFLRSSLASRAPPLSI